jgi:hypothetical protein
MFDNNDLGLDDPGRVISEITPSMDPKQVILNVKEYNRLTTNSSEIPVDEARKSLLQKSVQNPEDWTYFSNTTFDDPNDEKKVDKDLEIYKKRFPPGIEFLFIQGAYSGGLSNWGTGGGILPYRFDKNHFTVFVREKKELGSGKR